MFPYFYVFGFCMLHALDTRFLIAIKKSTCPFYLFLFHACSGLIKHLIQSFLLVGLKFNPKPKHLLAYAYSFFPFHSHVLSLIHTLSHTTRARARTTNPHLK
jgi:hypothetical protein